ncbi:hypothetical protein RSOLAG22IIIB_12460 [Rhizoctonia solani]|uniref:Uncharacterized protein n=1 Tax=Rhizoctonia solani TaxID=456999 RepID=A0A0K6GEG1_9AGAM|nr:hypothetical protein RSOLAG22IIIB_12460 [Rhizoctonia solani]
MPAPGAIRDALKGMLKSSGHIKHFRHQCVALIQICRDFWASMAMEDDNDYNSFHKFTIIANQALQAVASSTDNKKWSKDSLQEELDKAILDLEEFYGTLSDFKDYDPRELMLHARKKDQERNRTIAAVDTLKKIPKIKSEVDFYIHDGGDLSENIRLNISKKSTSEEVLFKLGRNLSPRIELHENAYFYTGRDFTWTDLKVMHIKWGSDSSTYNPKEGVSDFKTYFDSVPRGPIHVFVDRNPSIHLLLTTNKWSRLFSLSKLVDNGNTMVLKGADGILFHAQQVVGQIPSGTEYVVFQFDRTTNTKTRANASLPALPNHIEILLEARKFIITEGARRAKAGWLVQVTPNLDDPPSFSTKKHHKARIIHNSLPDAPSPRGLKMGKMEDATTHVRDMVARIEQEKRDAEDKKKEAEKRVKKGGLLNRFFGK